MNRNLVIAIAVVVVVSLGAAFILVPVLSQNTPGMTVTLYDADGEKVYQVGAPSGPFFEFGFQNQDGAAVVTALASIDYEVTMTGDLGDVTVGGELVVSSYPADMPDLPAIKSKSFVLQDTVGLSGVYEATLNLIDLIYDTAQGTAFSYKYVFVATLTASTADGIISEPWTDSIVLLIDWVPDGLSIVGSISVQ